MTDAERYPFTNFNFAVEISVPGISPEICRASFQECDGLEMTMEVKTIREGGNNSQQIRLNGPVSYGQLSLKRGMSPDFDLWRWFSVALASGKERTRGEALVVMFAPDGTTECARFKLSRCLPVKMKAPALNGKDGTIAIEEMQIAYEQLTLASPGES